MDEFRPDRYRLHLCPDLDRFTFQAQVSIDGVLSRPTQTLQLHARELEVATCTVEDAQGLLTATPRPDGEDRLTITLPRVAVGPIRVVLAYTGHINDKLAGFYRSRYHTGTGADGWLALTQFQESDARRALPCVDHPAAKAVFEVELELGPGQVALSNTPVAQESPLGAGRRRVRFAPTPKMSTYLLFFAVGPFVLHADGQDPRVRVATLPQVPPEQAALGLEFGREALRHCEAYFSIPYPLPKLDLIAVPDFAFGAMENWGAIPFRENLLLRVPGVTSCLGEERIAEVTAHEVVHQWFGNLVTPSDWQYLWLNESFATYFAYKILDQHRPDWQVWQTFVLGQTERALERDALPCTFAIEMPEDPARQVAITESTAPVIYSKGGSLLRQIEGYVGAAAFRTGLTTYLERHAYASAASHDLWDALGEAADQPVAALMGNWVEQPGHPVVEVERRGDHLHLRQRRFTLLPIRSEALWQIPLRVATFGSDGAVEHRELALEGPQAELALPPGTASYQVNAGQTGFFRVHYQNPADRDALGPRVRAGQLGPLDRWGLASDLYALVLAGRAPLDEYLAFLGWFDQEDQLLPLASIARALRRLHQVLPAAAGARVAEVGSRLLTGSLARIGTEPRDGEGHPTTVLRDQILWDAAVFGAPLALEAGRRACEGLRSGCPPAADVVKAALQVGVWTTPDPSACLAWLQARFTAADSEHERINCLAALGAFRDPATLRAALDFTLHQVPARIRFVPLVAAAANPEAGPTLWQWFEDHIAALETLHPMLFERVLAAVVPTAGLADVGRTRQFLGARQAQRPQLAEVVTLALENLAVNARLREGGEE